MRSLSHRRRPAARLPQLAAVLAPLAAVLVPLMVAGPAAAHGILQGSSPAPNTVLPSAPPEVVLAFNEPVDEALSSAQVVDEAGRSVGGPSEVVGGGRRIRVVVGSLPPGVYTVRWRVLSRLDGHVTSGGFLFAVGTQAAPQQRPDTGEEIRPPLVLARWAGLLAGLALAGAVIFQSFLLKPALAAAPAETALVVREAALPPLDRLRVASGWLLILASLAEFAAQAAAVLGPPLLRPGAVVSLLGSTRAGWSLLVRTFMALVLIAPARGGWRILRPAALVWFVVVAAVTALLGGPAALTSSHVTLIVLVGTVYGLVSLGASIILPGVADLRIPEGRWVRPAAAGLLLWGFTVNSHAAATGLVAVGLDWIHLVAAAAWIGGFPAFLLTLGGTPAGDRAALAPALVPRVSRAAAVALAALALTGVAAARATVQTLPALTTTLYGRALLLKVALVAALAVLGARNRFVHRPRIQAGRGGPALERLRRGVAAEVVIGAAVLLLVGVLTTTPPASVTMASRTASTLALAGFADGFRVTLFLTPPSPRWNDLRAVVTRADDGARVTEAQVQVTLAALDRAEDRTVILRPDGRGGYAASGDFLAPGWWEVRVAIRAAGRTVETTVPLVVAEAEGTAPAPGAGSGSAAEGQQAEAQQAEAQRLLAAARRAMARHRTWRETEQLTDGSGGVVLTRFEAQAPDRLRLRTSGGSETVILGAVRYSRERSGPWRRAELPQPIDLDGPYAVYFEGASGVRLGREDRCRAEPCRVVLWELPRASAHLAARIGLRTHTVHTLAMVAPAHFMTSYLSDLGKRVRIEPPAP